jgi:hypothetical protein
MFTLDPPETQLNICAYPLTYTLGKRHPLVKNCYPLNETIVCTESSSPEVLHLGTRLVRVPGPTAIAAPSTSPAVTTGSPAASAASSANIDKRGIFNLPTAATHPSPNATKSTYSSIVPSANGTGSPRTGLKPQYWAFHEDDARSLVGDVTSALAIMHSLGELAPGTCPCIDVNYFALPQGWRTAM